MSSVPPHLRAPSCGASRAGLVTALCALALLLPPAPAASTPLHGTWRELRAPESRSDHSAIFDGHRDHMVIFGGYTSASVNDVWVRTLSGVSSWRRLTPAGAPPSPRHGHAAIYDPVRQRMIVFGGSNQAGVRNNEVWALSLSGTQTWTQLAPSGTPPSPRTTHAAIYDPVRDRMIVFGGWTGSARVDEVWTLSLGTPPTWTQLAPAGTPPAGRVTHGALYDPARDRMVIFGGISGAGSDTKHNDLWALSLADAPAWELIAVAGPPPAPRSHLGMAYDPTRDRIVLFGGHIGGLGDNQVWAVSFNPAPAWTQLAPAGAPPAGRLSHTLILDPAARRLVVFGGYDGASPMNTLRTLSLADDLEWTHHLPQGTAPSPRYAPSGIHDSARGRMIVFGGFSLPGYHNDVHALSLDAPMTWTALAPAGTPPAARANHSAIHDPVEDVMVVFGGGTNVATFGDVHVLSLGESPEWSELSPSGTPPGGRSSHAAVRDPVRNRMLVIGGFNAGGFPTADVWALALGPRPEWTKLEPTGSKPTARGYLSAVYDEVQDRVLVFGGHTGLEVLDDLWELSLAGTPAWTRLEPLGPAPRARYGHAAIRDPWRGRMVMFAGYGVEGAGSVPIADAWELTSAPPVSVGPSPGAATALAARAYPNPAINTVSLRFTLPRAGRAVLRIYDLSGRRLATLVDEDLAAGEHLRRWEPAADGDARAPAGVYFCELVSGGERVTRRLVLLE